MRDDYGPEYYDIDGKPMAMGEWAPAFEDVNRHVGDDYLKLRGRVYRVSTVWIGLDMSFSIGPHRPVIFETMVFDDDGMELMMGRYSTKEQAARGHLRFVRLTKKMILTEPKPRQLIHNGGKP